jgi:hypothetical protein
MAEGGSETEQPQKSEPPVDSKKPTLEEDRASWGFAVKDNPRGQQLVDNFLRDKHKEPADASQPEPATSSQPSEAMHTPQGFKRFLNAFDKLRQ